MLRIREKLKDIGLRMTCAAAVALSLGACTQTTPTHTIGNTTSASAPQSSEMEEVVVSASRGPAS
jgi:hypothetical protein